MAGPPSDSGPPPDPWAAPSGQQPPPPVHPPPSAYPAYPQPAAYPTYPPPPAYWPVYPPAQRPRRRWVLWVVLAGILVVGGCGALVATLGTRAFHDFEGARSTTNEFLSAIERGDASRAQDLLCDEAAPDTVTRAMAAGITSHRITGIGMQSSFGSRPAARKTADVTVELTLADGVHRREVIPVTYEHELWLVCGLSPRGFRN